MAPSSRTITSVEDWVLRRPLDPYGNLGRLYPVTHACVGGRIACGLDFRGWPQQRQDVPWPNPVHGRAWRCPNCVRAVRIGRLAHGFKRNAARGDYSAQLPARLDVPQGCREAYWTTSGNVRPRI